MLLRCMQMQQLRPDQSRNRPVVIVGGLLVKLRYLYRHCIFFRHGGPLHFILKNTQSLSGRIWSPRRSRNVSAFFSRTVHLSCVGRNCFVTVAGMDACSKIRLLAASSVPGTMVPRGMYGDTSTAGTRSPSRSNLNS